jgi:glutamine synthetase
MGAGCLAANSKENQRMPSEKPKTPRDVSKIIEENGIKIVDFKFNDLIGLWQHFSIPATELLSGEYRDSSIWEDGLGFDGSSIRGFQKIHESDMILKPDATTAVVDPVCGVPTLSVICDIFDPLSKQPYSRDPRFIAQKAESYLKSTGIADTAFFGPEAEFFLFNDVRFDQNEHSGYYFIDSDEGTWNSGREEKPNLGYKPRFKEGYFPTAPHDSLQDIRSEMMLKLIEVGVPIEVHHHEVASGGQCEIDIRFSPLRDMADMLMMYKYVIKNMAKANGYTATFMPKPLYGDNGSGMHVHLSLWKDGETLMFKEGNYADLSDTARWMIGGILQHGKSILAFGAPTTNSYKRLVPGFEAPVNLVYSARNRSAAVRIPMYSLSPKAKRLEFRSTDAAANPYLTFPALLMAALDGIQNKIEPADPVNYDLFELEGDEAKSIPQVPRSLEEALQALEDDHEYLLKGDVFTRDVIETWIDYKRSVDIDNLRLRPHPYEFYMYYDC